MMSTELRIDVLLSVQRALLCEICKGMKQINIDWKADNGGNLASFKLHCAIDCHEGETEEIKESLECAATEIIADFPSCHDYECEVYDVDDAKNFLGECVFRTKE